MIATTPRVGEQGVVMRREPFTSFREDIANNSVDATAPRGSSAAEPFKRAPDAQDVSVRAPQPWIKAAEAVIDWYDAMFRLAFGLGRPHSRRELDSVAPPAAPPLAADSTPVAPLKSLSSAPVRLRARRKKSPSKANSRSRTSKMSSVRRARRAA
jgi:hypothetical protein